MIDMANITPLPSGHFRVRVGHLKQTVTGTVATLDEAVALRDEFKRQIVDGELAPTRASSALSLGPRFLAAREGNRSIDDDTKRWHKRVLAAGWATKPVATVTRKDGLAWLKVLAKSKTDYNPKSHGSRSRKLLSWGTRKHLLVLARRFFGWCVDVEQVLDTNPFAGLTIEREDGDEDEGYQEEWYVDLAEQKRLLGLWDTLPNLDWRDRLEKWMCGFALASGVRLSELWCLHLSDLHVDGPNPHIVVRYGSYDPIKGRFRSPKGRKGEKKKRMVPLWGLGLESAERWLEVRASYLEMTPKTARDRAAADHQESQLVFPTERGCLRDNKPPRSWKKVIAAFGVVPRIGRKPWWHLLRHSCASSLISGAWGDRWALEDVQAVLGHSDIRTTQRYAHLAPSAIQATAARAQAAFQLAKVIPIGRHASAVTAPRSAADAAREAVNSEHARQGSNLRPTAPERAGSRTIAEEIAWRDGRVSAYLEELRAIAEGRRPKATAEDVSYFVARLDEATTAYAAAKALSRAERGGSR